VEPTLSIFFLPSASRRNRYPLSESISFSLAVSPRYSLESCNLAILSSKVLIIRVATIYELKIWTPRLLTFVSRRTTSTDLPVGAGSILIELR
jgi:hypothetical protein